MSLLSTHDTSDLSASVSSGGASRKHATNSGSGKFVNPARLRDAERDGVDRFATVSKSVVAGRAVYLADNAGIDHEAEVAVG